MRHSMLILALTGGILSSAPVQTYSEQPVSIGVLPLAATGIETGDAATITEYLRDRLRLEKRFDILYRDIIEEKLAQQPEMPRFTSDDEAIRKAGETLGAQKIIVGSMGKVGDFFTISIKVFDTAAQTSFEVAEDHTGTIDSFQYETIEDVGQQITRKILSELTTESAPIPEPEATLKSTAKWYKKWWVWASAISGAAIVSGVAILAGGGGNNPIEKPTGDGPLPTPPDLP